MRLPMPAPDDEALYRSVLEGDPQRLLELLQYAGPDPYLHWDQLRYRTPPEGMSAEHWWLALRLRRRTQARTVPLRQKSGAEFSLVLTDRLLRTCEELTQRLGAPRLDASGALNRPTGDAHLIRSLVEEAITSSQLEGASTSRRAAKELLDSGRDPQDRSERMIVNNYAVMERVRDLAEEKLTPQLVLEVHRIATEGTLDDPADAGRLETPDHPRVAVWDNDLQLHAPPPAEELEERLQALCDFANDTSQGTYMPAIARAVVVHFMAGYDHYFADGNGRTARALFYWMMLKQGHWLAEFVSISTILRKAPSEYARAYLHTEDDDGDLTYFLHYQLDVLARAVDAFDAHLERKRRERDAAQQDVEVAVVAMNHRQAELLRRAVAEGGPGVVAAEPFARRHRVSDQTARNDLNDLAARGLLVRERQGRRNVFRVPADLAQRLRP